MTFSHAANVIEPDFFARLRNKKDPYKTDKAEAARSDARERLPFEYAQRAATLLVPLGAPNHNILTLGHALAYADAGLHVIDAHALDRAGVGTGPRKQIKLPRGARWQERATTDQSEIESFWSGDGEYPEDDHGESYPYARANVFRNVSAAFPKDCGLFVLDIDGDAGLDALEALEQEHGDLPQTWESITGSGGVHLIFQARDLDIRNTASSIAPGVDIRGANGQIIVPPSIHPNGNFYRWEIDCAPWECPVADAPEWLCKLAYEATKGRSETTKAKKASKKTMNEKRASARTDQSSNDVHGVGGHLAMIGDGEGQKGFNAPIYSALCSYFGTDGADAPAEPILEKVTAAIAKAERDPDRDRSKYDDEDYLLEQAEKARTFIEEQSEPAPDPITDHSEDGIKAALADASLSNDTELREFIRRCIDGDAGTLVKGSIVDVISKAKKVAKPDLKRMWVEEETKAKASMCEPASAGEALNTGSGFNNVYSETISRLREANDKDPFLFEMRGELFELRRTPDGPKLKRLHYDGLSEVICRHIDYVQFVDGNAVSVAPPKAVVTHVFHRDRNDYALPLVAISEIPFFDKAGTLVAENGYHHGTSIYLSLPDGFVLPRVSELPSEDELDRAFDIFLEVFGEFPFDGLSPNDLADNQSASLANVIGLACLPFMRPMIDGPTPGHLINKTAPGTGAGLLLFILHMIWTGRKPIVMTIPKRREEIGKTIIAKLRSGAFVIIFDNIPDNLDSDDLASALSEGVMDARVLGKNDAGAVDPVEVTTIWIFTGNDVTMSGELLRRMTLIDLDAGMTDPETRTFTKSEPELKTWVRDNREDLVWACLTLIQNWIARGRQPFDSELVKGTFSEWLAAVGGVMQAADLHHHFYGNEKKLREDSSSAADDALFAFASVLAEYKPGHAFSVGGDDPASILNLLNSGADGNPIEIHGWGYSQEDGSYGSASGLGKHIKKFARRPHKARRTLKGGCIDVEIALDREYDEYAKVNVYRLKFRAPGTTDWIMSEADEAWKALLKG